MIVTVYYSISDNSNTRLCVMDDTNKVTYFWYRFSHLIRKKPSKKFVRWLIEYSKKKGFSFTYVDLDACSLTKDSIIYKKDYEIDYNT